MKGRQAVIRACVRVYCADSRFGIASGSFPVLDDDEHLKYKIKPDYELCAVVKKRLAQTPLRKKINKSSKQGGDVSV